MIDLESLAPENYDIDVSINLIRTPSGFTCSIGAYDRESSHSVGKRGVVGEGPTVTEAVADAILRWTS